MKTSIRNLTTTVKTFAVLSIIAVFTGSYGDDTEVFYSSNVSKPNLLFILDVSGSMDTRVPNSGTSTNNTVSHTIERKVVNRDDDAEQAASGGSMYLRDTYLDIGYEYYDIVGPQRTGLRFYDLGIPQGAEITNAYIQFEVRDTDSHTSTPNALTIVGEAADDARRFSSTGSNTIAARTTTSESVDWNPPVWQSVGDRGAAQRTSDLTVIVQSIVDRNNWDEDNGMVFIIEGKSGNTGSRVAVSYDRSSSRAPTLHVEYDTLQAGTDKTRLEVMQASLRRVLEKAPDNVNVGLMNYGQISISNEVNGSYVSKYRHHAVSGISFPITDINAKAREIVPTNSDVYGLPNFPGENITVREYLADIADSWDATSYTPIVDALYEAALYFRGEKMHYGQNLPTINGSHPSTYDGSVVTTNISNTSGAGRVNSSSPKYKTPIGSSCQDNYIVLMTDGAPTYRYRSSYGGWYSDEGPFAKIRGTSNGPQGSLASAIGSCSGAVGVGEQGNCGAEITNYLATHDNLPNPTSSFPSGQEGNQFIETFTVGFGISGNSNTENYLKSLATYDDDDSSTNNDGYYPASSPEELASAFKGILEEVAAPRGTLASPGYSVNVKNGLENEKDIYIPVFDRKNSSRWSGNLKKFRIVDVDDKRVIRGKNGLNVTDELGNFTTNALDYWSESPASNPDGRAVEKGGLASLLKDPSSRKIYSNLTGNSNVALTAANNLLHNSNISNIDNDVLGLPDNTDLDTRKKIVNFMRGWKDGDPNGGTDGNGVARLHMGDMLHSEPVIITYNKGSGGSGKQQYVFATTNEGYLHAFDAVTGEEKFAFIPKELLKNAEPQLQNAGTQVDHKYGIDGTTTYWFKGGRDGGLDSGDQIILYFGLRRGGSSFYALDVTDIDTPKLLWTKSASDYPSMGQSWSIPYLDRVGKAGSTCENGKSDCKEVVIISGGYDEDEDRDKTDGSGQVDDATSSVIADVGNDILILDAENGDLVWSMPDSMRSKIKSSIPGGVRIIDTNQNKLVDRMYFADTGGFVWRLDLSEKIGDSSTTASVLTKFADLGSTGRGANARMFFNEPDVATLKLNGHSVFTVSIGSGFRAHPMDESIDDKFFILVDKSPYKTLETSGSNEFETITSSDLASISISSSGITQNGSIEDVDKKGWLVNLGENGEKVLSTALSFGGKITFSTLVPEASSVGVGIDQCAAPVTQSRTYILNLLSGKSAISEIYIPGPPGVPNIPQRFFNAPEITSSGGGGDDDDDDDDDGNVKKSCTHPVDLRQGTKLSQMTGYDACKLESIYWSDPVTK